MTRLGHGAGAHKACRVGVAMAGLHFLVGVHTALAQTPPPAAVDQAPSEAARRAALSPYRFILQNASAPARKPQPAQPAPPANSAPAAPAAAAAEVRRPAAPAVEQAAARPAPAPVQAAASAPHAAPEPMPESLAALTRRSEEPPPAPARLEVIPVKTEEPRLPSALMRERPSGTVRVHFDINPDGSTGGVKVVSSTNRSLNRPSLEAVSNWKFEPVDAVLTVETELVYKYE